MTLSKNTTLSLVAFYFISLAAHAKTKECAQLALGGSYSCKMEGMSIRLEVTQDANNFSFKAITPEGNANTSYVADETRRGFTEAGRIDEYVGSCADQTLVIEQFLKNSSLTTGFEKYTKTKTGVKYQKVEMNSSGQVVDDLTLNCNGCS